MRALVMATAIAALIPAVTSGADAAASAPICGAHAADDAKAATAAGPDWTNHPPAPAEAILAGYGSGGFAIRTSNPRAQAFFDNGMQLGHAFAHKASVAAFEAAAKADPGCAMCLWGEAWARGPTINFGVDDDAQAQLEAIADKAAALAKDGPPLELQLIQALQLRYRHGGGSGDGDHAYAQAMDRIARAHPDNADLAVMAAHAWMIPVSNTGAWRPRQPDLEKAAGLLRTVLARDPDNTGAIHFYIHVSEMLGQPAQAVPYAQRLEALAPSASHLLHMPSHVYFWTGRYEAALKANLDATAVDLKNAERLKLKDGVWGLIYHSHNVAFGMGSGLMSGDASAALALARPVIATPEDPRIGQPTVGRAYFAMGRFADPAEVAALPDPGPAMPYVQAMWRYARGEADARRGDARAVRAEAALIAVDPGVLKGFGYGADAADGVVRITRLVLEGRADLLEHRPDAAAKAFKQAAEIQETRLRLQTDPPAFWFPVRRGLADAELQMGKTAEAAKDARRALAGWPDDPVTLEVLAKAEAAQGQRAAAAHLLAEASAAWKGPAMGLGPAGA